jgi:hypothetical protein
MTDGANKPRQDRISHTGNERCQRQADTSLKGPQSRCDRVHKVGQK